MAKKNELSAKYQLVKTMDDIRFGSVKLCRNPTENAYYTYLSRIFHNKEMASRLVDELNKRIAHPNLYYVPLVDYDFETIHHFCSTVYKLDVYIPFAEEDLQKEVRKRILYDQHFSNQEITFLLYDIVYGMCHLQELGFVHGLFGPEFVARTTTGYAVMENPLLDHFSGIRQCVNTKIRKELYLSPEAFKAFKGYISAGKDYSLTKSDVFSVGLVILEAGICKKIGEIYKTEGSGFGYGILNVLLGIFETKFKDNNLLTTTVRKMLEPLEGNRPDFIEIKAKLPPYGMIKEYFREAPMNQEAHSSIKNSLQGNKIESLFSNKENLNPKKHKGFGSTNEGVQIGQKLPHLTPKRTRTPFQQCNQNKGPQFGDKQDIRIEVGADIRSPSDSGSYGSIKDNSHRNSVKDLKIPSISSESDKKQPQNVLQRKLSNKGSIIPEKKQAPIQASLSPNPNLGFTISDRLGGNRRQSRTSLQRNADSTGRESANSNRRSHSLSRQSNRSVSPLHASFKPQNTGQVVQVPPPKRPPLPESVVRKEKESERYFTTEENTQFTQSGAQRSEQVERTIGRRFENGTPGQINLPPMQAMVTREFTSSSRREDMRIGPEIHPFIADSSRDLSFLNNGARRASIINQQIGDCKQEWDNLGLNMTQHKALQQDSYIKQEFRENQRTEYIEQSSKRMLEESHRYTTMTNQVACNAQSPAKYTYMHDENSHYDQLIRDISPQKSSYRVERSYSQRGGQFRSPVKYTVRGQHSPYRTSAQDQKQSYYPEGRPPFINLSPNITHKEYRKVTISGSPSPNRVSGVQRLEYGKPISGGMRASYFDRSESSYTPNSTIKKQSCPLQDSEYTPTPYLDYKDCDLDFIDSSKQYQNTLVRVPLDVTNINDDFGHYRRYLEDDDEQIEYEEDI